MIGGLAQFKHTVVKQIGGVPDRHDEFVHHDEQISNSLFPTPVKSKKRKHVLLTNNIPPASFVEILDRNTLLLQLYDLSQLLVEMFSNSLWLIIQEDFPQCNVKKGQVFQTKMLHYDGYSIVGFFLNDDCSHNEVTHRIRYEAFLCEKFIVDYYNNDKEEDDDGAVVLCSTRKFAD